MQVGSRSIPGSYSLGKVILLSPPSRARSSIALPSSMPNSAWAFIFAMVLIRRKLCLLPSLRLTVRLDLTLRSRLSSELCLAGVSFSVTT